LREPRRNVDLEGERSVGISSHRKGEEKKKSPWEQNDTKERKRNLGGGGKELIGERKKGSGGPVRQCGKKLNKGELRKENFSQIGAKLRGERHQLRRGFSRKKVARKKSVVEEGVGEKKKR